MDLLLQQALPIFFLLLTIIIFSRKIRAGDGKTGHRQLAPAPGWKLPVIGHLHHFLTSRQLPHRLLRELARKHGDMIRLDLGEIQHVLVSSAEAAKEVAKVMYGGVNLIQAPYGDYWRQLRRIATLELLTAKLVDSLRRVRESEVLALVRSMAAAAGTGATTVNLTRMLYDFSYRIISLATFGDVSEEQEEFTKPVQKLFGTEELLNRIHVVLDRSARSMVAQHQAARAAAAAKEAEGMRSRTEEDLLDVLLNIQEGGDATLGFHLSTDAIKGFLLDIFLAGSETPSALIEWTMSNMMKHPKVLHEAQSEVRRVFGERGRVAEAGMCELSYLKLVIKETLRLYTPAPLVLPRECREECRISGYDVPLKTRVLVNAWAIARDPRYWGEDAEEFVPERFHDSKLSFRGTDFEFLPFGAGRRMCPGMTFGLATVELPLASLLFHFDWKLPPGVEPSSFNMDEQFGVTLRRKNHLELIPVVRLAITLCPRFNYLVCSLISSSFATG
ncbi:unnamed protein product [Linum tenue]|uniref:Cytochrome P450 n=1 Tax=Linum tenue TaxID=586396 RepID=A0AAV0M0N5_9ROSI|nr:unnamed protein product [Linum tenue]